MKQVLIVATTSYAGMGPYVTNIYNTFSPEDHVYFLGREYVEMYFQKNIKEELKPMCTFYKKANTHWNTLIGIFFPDKTFEKLVLKICKEKNIGVVHYINRPLSATMIRTLHKHGIKTLGTVHDLHPHDACKAWYKMFRHMMVSRRLKREMLLSDNLMTNSLVQFKELQTLYSGKSSYYVPFPTLVTESIANGTLTPPELQICDKPYILFFGLIEEYKGIDYLVRAFADSKDVQDKYNIVIAGRGTLKEEWLQHKDKGIVFINRFIKDEEVRSLYEKASMVVYPYISATQSGVLSLAFYFGTPTIASDIPFFKSIIEPSGAGALYSAGNHVGIIDCIQKIEINKKNIVKAEKNYYANNYGNSLIRKKLLEIYKLL